MSIMADHHFWAVAFGVLGNIISVLVYLAPVPTFYRIYKKKSTESFQSLPYQVALFSSMLWLYYALIKKGAFLLITINSFGCVVETIYISMYIAYASKNSRMSAMKLFVGMNVGLFSLILIVTHFAVKSSIRAQTLGWISVTISVCVFAAPLNIVARVIRTKSVEFMPFNLSFFLTLSAIMWFSYGMFIKDVCVALPNVIGFILGMLQMVLYGIYRNPKAAVKEENKKAAASDQALKSVVVLSTLGGSEVYPVDIQPESIDKHHLNNNNNNNTSTNDQVQDEDQGVNVNQQTETEVAAADHHDVKASEDECPV